MKHVVNRVSILPAAKVSAGVCGIMFLFIGLVYGGVLGVLALVDVAGGGDIASGGIGLAVSLLALIGLPIAGIIFGAIKGAVLALAYNFVADYVGGLEVMVAEKSSPQKAPESIQ